MKSNNVKNTQGDSSWSPGNNVSGSQAGSGGEKSVLSPEHDAVLAKIMELYTDLFLHDGYGSINIEMRFLKKGQKEIIINCGKDFRFVLDWLDRSDNRRK